MTTVTVSSKGRMVLPSNIRRRLGLITGTQLEIIEETQGLRLVVARPVKITSVSACAGMVTAPSKGVPRRLVDFDSATMMATAYKDNRLD